MEYFWWNLIKDQNVHNIIKSMTELLMFIFYVFSVIGLVGYSKFYWSTYLISMIHSWMLFIRVLKDLKFLEFNSVDARL